MLKRIIYIALALILATSCVYPFNADIPSEIDKTLVVEGRIVLGGYSEINLSCVRTFDGKYSAPPSAEITLEEENGVVYPAELIISGKYRLRTENANQDSRYRLRIVYEEKEYATDWATLADTPIINRIDFTANKTDVTVSVSVNGKDAKCNYLAASFQEIWYFHASFVKELGYNVETNSVYRIEEPDETYYRCWKSETSPERLLDCSKMDGIVQNWAITSFPRTSNRNHGDYTIKVSARCLTQEEFRYWKLLDDNSNIGGNLFSPEPGELASNLKCISDETTPVYGYVTYSKACSAEAHLDGKFYKEHVDDGLYQIEVDQYLEFYNMGYEPVKEMNVIFLGGVGTVPGWGTLRCYNCVAAGGTLEKPEFN